MFYRSYISYDTSFSYMHVYQSLMKHQGMGLKKKMHVHIIDTVSHDLQSYMYNVACCLSIAI